MGSLSPELRMSDSSSGGISLSFFIHSVSMLIAIDTLISLI